MEKLIDMLFEFYSDEKDEETSSKLTGKVIGFYKPSLSEPKIILVQQETDLVHVVPVSKLHKKVKILNTNR